MDLSNTQSSSAIRETNIICKIHNPVTPVTLALCHLSSRNFPFPDPSFSHSLSINSSIIDITQSTQLDSLNSPSITQSPFLFFSLLSPINLSDNQSFTVW